jgi:hypothetical protein
MLNKLDMSLVNPVASSEKELQELRTVASSVVLVEGVVDEGL